MSKKKKIWIICTAAVALVIIIVVSIRATRRDEVAVQTAKVIRKDVLKAQVSASGQIRAKDYANLQAEVVGVVTNLMVREGDKVKKGDLLAKIDPIQTAAATDASQAQLDAARQDLQSQQFQISIAEHNLANAKVQLETAHSQQEQADATLLRTKNSFRRSQQMSEDGIISREEYELAQNNLKTAQAQADIAKKTVEQMENGIKISDNNLLQMKNSFDAARTRLKAQDANLTQLTDQLKKTNLISPLNGVITQLVVHEGERAVPGTLNSPQATLMTISDLSVIQTELKVDETDIVNLAIGNPAKIKVDALPDLVLDGEVTEIGNSPITTSTTTQEAKDFKVIVTVKNPPDKIRPGMSCTADINTETRTNVLAIPIQALTIREVEVDKNGKYIEPDLSKPEKSKIQTVAQADSAKTKINKKELEGVFVINKDNRARFRPVQTGITGESEIEVKSNLQEGETIVSGSFQTLRTLKDGAFVKAEAAVTKTETTNK